MKSFIIIAICLCFTSLLFSQESLTKIGIPSSPAASVIGLQPTTVLTPKNFQAFEASIFSNFLSKSGGMVVPEDFAIEFTPYWTSKPKVSFEEYLDPKLNFEQIGRNSSFSIASTRKFYYEDSTATNSIGFGYRTTIYVGQSSATEKWKNDINQHKKNMLNMDYVLRTFIAEYQSIALIQQDNGEIKKSLKANIKAKIDAKSFNASQDIISRVIPAIYDSLDAVDKLDDVTLERIIANVLGTNAVYKKVKQAIQERPGLSIDFALAGMLNFPTNNFEYSEVPHYSFWITPSYRLPGDGYVVTVQGVFRAESYNTDFYQKHFPKAKYYQSNIDYGFAMQYEADKYLLSFEVVGRSSKTETPAGVDALGRKLFAKESDSDLQYTGTFTYRVNDQVAVNYTIGNGFKPALNPKSTLLSMLNLSLAFNAATVENVK